MTSPSSIRGDVSITSALLLFYISVLYLLLSNNVSAMSIEEKRELRDQTTSMFRHAYDSYMKYAFPADELMPLSCRGRFRGSEPSRGNDDDALGNFTLTLVDTLDSLALIDLDEFEKATRLVVERVKFDTDVVVSVFETNIRMLGGLLGGHAMAIDVKQRHSRMLWYEDQLLRLSEDLGRRLLPAFNSTTGIPFSRINLRHGIDKNARETCTACAGTMILEFAALSRLSGDPVFETKARLAMEQLWNFRHRESDLVGTVIDVESGEWQRRDSGIGAGIDSYYEYLFKGYILLSDDDYLDRFNAHYKSIQKYVQRGTLWVDVHMHKPTTTAKNFMDALSAYWPGLQVLKGDLTSAIETHEMLYQVMQRHGGFLPEAFTTDFRVHWGQSPLRPEFIESTYFLYKATGDEHYLEVGKAVLNSIEVMARVPCGYAAIKDVRTGRHEDRMDSFVLAELFKYLFLLFSEESELPININDYLFTTEAHLLPLKIGSSRGGETVSSSSSTPPLLTPEEGEDDYDDDDDDEATCPAHPQLKMRFPGMTEDIRKPLKNLVEQACPSAESPSVDTPQIRASEFQAGNKDHVATLEKMGIRLVTMKDGRVQLLQTTSQAATTEDARQGMMFMQDMIQLSKTAAVQEEPQTRLVRYLDEEAGSGSVGEDAKVVDLIGGPAQFGYDLSTQRSVEAELLIMKPFSGCGEISNAEEDVRGKIAVMQRGDCMFVVKARAVEKMGAVGGIVIDNNADSSASASPIFAMSGDGSDDVGIPLVFLFDLEGRRLLHAHWKKPRMKVVLTDGKNPSSPKKTTTSTVTTIEEEFKVVTASDKDENNDAESKSNLANESHEKYLDVFQVLDGDSEIVHVGNDELKLVIRSIRNSGRENPGWLFHPTLRVVDYGKNLDLENSEHQTEKSKRKFYLYIDADVPSSASSSSSSSTSSPPCDAANSPPWEQLRTSILSVLEATTNLKSSDADAGEVEDSVDTLTFIASRALDRQRGKASRLRLSDLQMRRFKDLSQRLRVLDEAIVEREIVDDQKEFDYKEAVASLSSSSPSYSIPRQSPPLVPQTTSETSEARTSLNNQELDSKSPAPSDLPTDDVLQQQQQHSTVDSSPESEERWRNLKLRSRADTELADLLDEVENFLQDPELQRYVQAADQLGLSKEDSSGDSGETVEEEEVQEQEVEEQEEED